MDDSTVTPPNLKPALLPSVHLSLTIIYISLYALLFLIIYVQLWMILYFKHKRLSYQSVFLFLCLIWSGLRTSLFSFYFKNAAQANYLPSFLYWLLYCFPVCLQFTTLCLLFTFFTQVHFRQNIEIGPNMAKKVLWGGTTAAVVAFFITNITCAILINKQTLLFSDPPDALIYTRVVVNDFLFIIFAILLSISIYKVSRLPTNFQVLESQGTTKRQAILVGLFIVPLYVSRAVYNIVAIMQPKLVTFGYSWINVSDQADVNSAEKGFLTFGIILFFWEFLPTFIVVMFFRVKLPRNELTLIGQPSGSSGHFLGTSGQFISTSNAAFFFDNPRRYDSDDELNRISNSVDRPVTAHSEGHMSPLVAPRTTELENWPPLGTPPVLYANTGPLSHDRPPSQSADS